MPLHLYITSSSCNKISSYSNNYCLRFKDKSLIDSKKIRFYIFQGLVIKRTRKTLIIIMYISAARRK